MDIWEKETEKSTKESKKPKKIKRKRYIGAMNLIVQYSDGSQLVIKAGEPVKASENELGRLFRYGRIKEG